MPCLCAALEGVGDLRPELHDLVERQRALLQAIREDLAFEQLHHQEVRVALVADVEERADVGVVERGDRLGLALEALAALLVLGEGGGEDLDGDAAVEAGVLPPPDLAHSAGADRRRQLVGPEPRSGLDCHGVGESIAPPPAPARASLREGRAGVHLTGDLADVRAALAGKDPRGGLRV